MDDGSDLTVLIDAYRGPLMGLLAYWGAPWADAAELAQDTFAEAWLHRQSCRGDWREAAAFGRWLRGVAWNVYRNWARGARRRNRLIAVDSTVVERTAAPSEAEPSDDLEALRLAITRLPARQRQVVLMHYLEETSVKQVAALLSVTPKTIEGRLYQARRTLRRLLEQNPSDSQISRVLLCL